MIRRLHKEGFTNIRVEEVEDLVTGWINKEGGIKIVIVGGKKRFSRNSRFFPDDEIVIKYHSFKTKK